MTVTNKEIAAGFAAATGHKAGQSSSGKASHCAAACTAGMPSLKSSMLFRMAPHPSSPPCAAMFQVALVAKSKYQKNFSERTTP